MNLTWFQIWALFGLPISLAIGGYLYIAHANRALDRRYGHKDH